MDFFTAVKDSVQRAAPTDNDDVNSFSHAIASSAPLLISTPPVRFPSSPMANMSLASPSTHTFLAVPPNDLEPFLNDTTTLIIDIRPHAAYSSARIPHALSLSVPSTLLKRPLFSLARLSAMLPCQSSRTRFSAWSSASRILVYDADSTAIPDSSNIQGLLRKFKKDGFQGNLAWLQGGFQAVWRERLNIIDTNLYASEAELDEDDEDDDCPTNLTSSSSMSLLQPRHLPMSAFSTSSTAAHTTFTSSPAKCKHKPYPSMSIPLPTSQPLARNAFNPFFDAVRQNVELSQGITERIPLQLPRRVHRRVHDLPFAWLRDIAKKAECAPRVPHHYIHNHRLSLSPTSQSPPSSSSSDDTSDSDTSPDPGDIEEGTEALAMQFYRIEVAEQRRLMSVMDRHSRESGLVNGGATQSSLTFPYSITAGVEKGSKNRYRHIWPFEHARVRLHCRNEDQQRNDTCLKRDTDDADNDDYVNASYVQPLGTRRRYIATQGPLEATFNDFWRLCWEQNVHVVVMLTKEIEGLTVKCGSYWVEDEGRERSFGPLTLKLVSKVGLSRFRMEPQVSGGDFPASDIPHATPHPPNSAHPPSVDPLSVHRRRRKPITTVKRTFELSHSRYPHLGARKVVQLQYLEWPDMNVPDDPRGILGLIKEVEKAVGETWDGGGAIAALDDTEMDKEINPTRNLDEHSGISRYALGGKERRPVLLHCSAGVGRTGGFIAVDAVLDAVRRELRRGKGQERKMEGLMDVDTTSQNEDVDDVGVMTVPIPVGEGKKANVAGTSAGLVMHVPVVVVPETTGGDVPRTPMQVDGEREPCVGDQGPSASTREWAQHVMDQTGGTSPTPYPTPSFFGSATGRTIAHNATSGVTPIDARISHHHPQEHHHPKTLFKTASSSSSSTLPTDSEDSGSLGIRRIQRKGSSLGTSVSGSSEEEKLVGLVKRTESPLGMSSRAASEEADNVKENRVKTLGQKQRRPRTLSAPHTHLTNMSSHLRGVGPSPLASLPTPWLAGRRDKNQMTRLAEAGLIGSSSDEDPSPSQMTASTRDEDKMASSLPPQSTPDPRHVLSKSSPPLPHPSSSPEQTPNRLAAEPYDPTVDYKEPRRLHVLNSPALLSSFEEPIWEVVQDMREQRMSLCQSLRQYVFVHAAIIEGALMIVGEEREREREMEMGVGSKMSAPVGTKSQSNTGVRSSHSSFANEGRPTPTVPFVHPVVPAPPVVRPSLTMFTNTSEVSMTSISSTGKRGASPTELLKEGKKGEVLLSKRPSIKRKQTRPSERGPNSDQRTVAFHKQCQGQNYYQAGQGTGSLSASASAIGVHLLLEVLPSSPSSSSSLS